MAGVPKKVSGTWGKGRSLDFFFLRLAWGHISLLLQYLISYPDWPHLMWKRIPQRHQYQDLKIVRGPRDHQENSEFYSIDIRENVYIEVSLCFSIFRLSVHLSTFLTGISLLIKMPCFLNCFTFIILTLVHFSSVQFSFSVMSKSLLPHEPQRTTPGVHPNPCPLTLVHLL